MEESHPKQIDQELYSTQGIKFKTQHKSPPPFKISRQRSVSPLQIKDRNQSPHTKNFKEKHLMYKKDLLQQRFQNLHINTKQEKKPMKLKLERVNKQNMIFLKQLNDISNGLQIKFEAQNSLIKRSLQKMQKIVIRSIHNKPLEKPLDRPLERIEYLKRIESKPKLQKSKIELGSTENQKNLQNQLENEISQKAKLQEEIKGMKSVNQFLATQNYKLSIEISMLKQRIIEYEQVDYDNVLKTIKDISSEDSKSGQIDKEEKQQYFSNNEESEQKSQVFDRKLTQQKIESNQNLFKDKIISQKSLEYPKPKQKTSMVTSHFRQIKQSFILNPQEIVQQCAKCQNTASAAEQIVRLIGQINDLEQELQQQKKINESLSRRIESLKIHLHQGIYAKNKNEQSLVDDRIDSAISINMDIKRNQQQQSQNFESDGFSSQHQDGIKQSGQMLDPAPFSYTHKATKSHISNQIIYFAEPISLENDKALQRSNQNFYPQRESISKKPQKNVIQRKQSEKEEENNEEENSEERKKIFYMQKLQVPALQVEKRRKSITQKLSSTMQSKSQTIGNNSLSFYSNQKVNQLQIIRQTISLKFQAFKYTFQLFQNQMILWPNGKLNVKQVKSILSEYPFFLDDSSIQVLLNYCGAVQRKDTKVDKFCNKIKQFIEEYQEMSEEEELILEKKIYKRWKYTKDQILEVMKKYESVSGEINKAKFIAVLEQFKFEEKEIHHLLSQSVAISSDINHIKYRQYLANFLTKN